MVKPIRTVAKIDALLDEVKDEVDRLHDIISDKRREDAAKNLAEYLELHFGVRA